MIISYQQILKTLTEILEQKGMVPEKAQLCARLFADASRDGVYSHGLNRFPVFIKMIKHGYVKVNKDPEVVDGLGTFERWDGKQGVGNVNAHFCMDRAIQLAKEHGMGCVTIRNTNHWMRGGNYGWQAADEGCLAICFTNTTPNMPPWKGDQAKIGNNPLIMAVPRKNGHIVMDIAMSQFSYGKIADFKRKNQQLSYDGGFDSSGNLTKDPAEIEKSQRALPIGLWKGAGLSLMLDLFLSILSKGLSTYHIGQQNVEHNISQCFICFDPKMIGLDKYPDDMIDEILAYICEDESGKQNIGYPGKHTLEIREDHMKNGIPVDDGIWELIINN